MSLVLSDGNRVNWHAKIWRGDRAPCTPRFLRPRTYVVRKLGLDDYQLKLTCLQVLKVSGGNPKLPILVCTIATQWTLFHILINTINNTNIGSFKRSFNLTYQTSHNEVKEKIGYLHYFFLQIGNLPFCTFPWKKCTFKQTLSNINLLQTVSKSSFPK